MTTAIPSPIREILEMARWAPSGDNTQPWRFEIVDDNRVVVHGFDTRDHCVYDLDGHPSQLAVGTLLETLSVAAAAQGRRARITRRPDTPETHLLFDVHLEPDPEVKPDPLAAFIEKRTVQRRAMSTRPITSEERAKLSKALGDAYEVVWFEALAQRWRMAKLCFDNARIRLTIPEAYEVHRAIIEWNAAFSDDKVPDRALGLDPLTLRLMRWVMASWQRVQFFNTYLAGTLAPRIQLDLVPGLACSAHFALVAKTPPVTVDDYVSAGRALQRFWLTATSAGLQLQPEMTPLIFSRYVREGRTFTRVPQAQQSAAALSERLTRLLGVEPLHRVVFLGRLGAGPAAVSRSLRLPVQNLLHH